MSNIAPYSLKDGTNTSGNYQILENDRPFCIIDGASTDVLGAVRVVLGLNLLARYDEYQARAVPIQIPQSQEA